MAHHSQRLLACIDQGFGWQGGPGFLTGIVATRGGFESRNRYWAIAKFSYEIGLVARPVSEFAAIKAAFMVCGGRADTFLFRDATDYSATVSNGMLRALENEVFLATGIGYGTPVYELAKSYAFASSTYYRPILAPTSNVIVYRGGSPVTEGLSAGQIDLTDGTVTFVADQSRAIVSHVAGINHQFTAASAFSPNFVGTTGRVYITGVTGTAADVLNNQSHAVTSVTGAQITTGTNTTGLTASGGTAYYYPQPTETLTFAGDFDIKVRFDVDEIMPTVINRTPGSSGELIIELPSITLKEVRE